jgi:hypothetical protein
MSVLRTIIDLLGRLGTELDFDVSHDVEGSSGAADVVWFDRRLPIARSAGVPLDLRATPALPVVAFAVRTAAMLGDADIMPIIASLEGTAAPLRILIIGRDGGQVALAPALQSVDRLRRLDDDAALRARIAASLGANTQASGRTLVMLQSDLVDWARGLREARPRSYSAESLFNRTGAID